MSRERVPMGRFLARQKKVQAVWRESSSALSDNARLNDGCYSKSGNGPYDFCLPTECADENLFSGIRPQSKEYFARPPGSLGGRVKIPWHDGKNGSPSSHLCDSQVCCLNFLYPLRENKDAATRLLSEAFPECVEAIPVQAGEDGFIEFEWVGNPDDDLIGEGSPRTRGANATSTDASAAFSDEKGNRHLVLIEWKYTESYPISEKITHGKFDEVGSGATRRRRYQSLFEHTDGPVDTSLVELADLGYEPFYQFLRQQLLAQALMPGWDSVRVLHIAPRANTDFATVTPSVLRDVGFGNTATAVWAHLLRNKSSFASVYTEDVFGSLVSSPPDGLDSWAQYILDRYSFMTE